MSAKAMTTKEPLAEEITEDQIQRLIAERKSVGATSCAVERESGQRVLVCQWPPP